MLVDLGITRGMDGESDRSGMRRMEGRDEREKEVIRLTWSGVVRIDLTSAWGESFLHPLRLYFDGWTFRVR
jgi:hypothetical protein